MGSLLKPVARVVRFAGKPFAVLARHRALLWQTTRSDIRGRYAGSALGLAWLFLFPLMFLGCYALVFGYVFQAKYPGAVETGEGSRLGFVVMVFCGLIPFLSFADSLGTGVSSVTSNANLIKNTLFPIELIPVKVVLVSQCTQLVGVGMLLVAVTAAGTLTWWALLLPAVWLLQLMFTMGMLWVLSSLNVYLRDLQNVVSVMILMLMMVSPIAWTIENVPGPLRPVMGLNPLYYILLSYQECLFRGRFPVGNVFWGLLILGPVSFWFGYWFFTRMKRVFADNV